MATEARKYQVGLFVIVASVIAVGTVIWLGASRYFERTEPYVTYFSETVQGLDSGASVKYRGVPSGRVAKISIAPDGELIEVLMDMDPAVAKALGGDPTLRATLELSGITGLRYVEIDKRSGSALSQSPDLHFQPQHPLIPSARSSFKAVQQALGDVYDRVMQVDLPGISDDVRKTLQSLQQILGDPRIDTSIARLQSTMESADEVARNLKGMTSGVKLAPAVDNATHAADEARRLFSELTRGTTGQQFSQAVSQMNVLVQSTQQAVVSLQSTLQHLDRAAGNLQGLTGDLRAQPSRLLFSDPPAPRSAHEGAPR